MNQVIRLNVNNELSKIGSEFSLATRFCLDGDEIKDLTRISKIFLILNGATGAQIENIPLPLAGHFVIWANNVIYMKLKLLRNEIQSYSRSNQFTTTKMNRILSLFDNLYQCIEHMVFIERGNIEDNISYDISKVELEKFDRFNTRNYNTFENSSWKQWFVKVESEFDNLEQHCRNKINQYDISNMSTWDYVKSFFYPSYWWDTVKRGIYGFVPYKSKVSSYKEVREEVNKRGTVIFNRREDVMTAFDTLQQFNLTLRTEFDELQNYEHARDNTPFNQQRVIAFTNECDRYFAMIRAQFGFLQENQNFQ